MKNGKEKQTEKKGALLAYSYGALGLWLVSDICESTYTLRLPGRYSILNKLTQLNELKYAYNWASSIQIDNYIS